MSRLVATSRPLLFLSFIVFVSRRLPDGLLGVAWPSMRQTFGLPLDALGALFISGTLGYWLLEQLPSSTRPSVGGTA